LLGERKKGEDTQEKKRTAPVTPPYSKGEKGGRGSEVDHVMVRGQHQGKRQEKRETEWRPTDGKN